MTSHRCSCCVTVSQRVTTGELRCRTFPATNEVERARRVGRGEEPRRVEEDDAGHLHLPCYRESRPTGYARPTWSAGLRGTLSVRGLYPSRETCLMSTSGDGVGEESDGSMPLTNPPVGQLDRDARSGPEKSTSHRSPPQRQEESVITMLLRGGRDFNGMESPRMTHRASSR